MSTKLHLINVSGGDATLIEHKPGPRSYFVLIDGGQDRNVTHEYLKNLGVKRLNLVIASHLDFDHINGLLEVFNDPSIRIDEFWTFDISILKSFLETGTLPPNPPLDDELVYNLLPAHDLLDRCEVRGVSCKQVVKGDVARIGGLVLEVLYPSKDFLDFVYRPGTLKSVLERSAIPPEWVIGSHIFSPQQVIEAGKRRVHNKVRFPKDDTTILTWAQAARSKFTSLLEHKNSVESTLNEELESSSLENTEATSRKSGTADRRFTITSIFNDISSVVKISSIRRDGATSALFCGDLENWTSLIMSDGHQLSCDYFKIPHHGSHGVRWLPREALHYSQVRVGRVMKSGLPPRSSDFFPTCLCPAVFSLSSLRGDFGEILDLVGAPDALIFPFPRYNLPHSDVMQALKVRGVTVHASSPKSSRSSPPTATVVPFD